MIRVLKSEAIFLSFVLVFSGCETPISLKNDVFQHKPLWRSTALGADVVSLGPPVKIDRAQAPGLYNLVAQVLGPNDVGLANSNPAATLGPFSLGGGVSLAAGDENPLPDELAKLPATKAAVSAIRASYLGEDVPDVKLNAQDFRDLGETFLRSSLDTYQNPTPARLGKLAAFAVGHQLTWQGLASKYFTEYYKGTFVDRTGGKLSKPTIGLKIPNESITSALTVFLEATCDYALLQNKGHVYNPVVFSPDEKDPQKPVYETKDNAKPTLIETLQVAAGQTGKQLDGMPPYIEGIIQPLQTDDKLPGITKTKLDTIRLLSGYAADASGSLSDLVMRTFGGIHIGFGIMGKISVGDNDTLAKMVQTTADLMAKRTTEAAVATFLYRRIQPAKATLAAPKDIADIIGYSGTATSPQ